MRPRTAGGQRPERPSGTEQIVRRTGCLLLPCAMLLPAMLLSGPAWGDDRADVLPARRCGPEYGGRILTDALFASGDPDAPAAPRMCDIPVRGPRQGAPSAVEHGTGISHDTRPTAERSDAPTPHPDCTGGRDTTEHPK